jgi:hypothetical protein
MLHPGRADRPARRRPARSDPRLLPVPSEPTRRSPVTNSNLYIDVQIVFVVHAQRFKSAHGPCFSPFRTRRIHRSSHERDPASIHHPPGGTRVHHRPWPLRDERAARASASRFILLNPPSGAFRLCTSPARSRSLAPPCDRLLHSSILAPLPARKRI